MTSIVQPYRVHDRRAVRLDARIRFPSTNARTASSNRSFVARVVDVGLGGACVETAAASPNPVARSPLDVRVGERATLSFQAPSLWDPLEVAARVVWVRSGYPSPDVARFGVAFEGLTPASSLALFELIAGSVFE